MSFISQSATGIRQRIVQQDGTREEQLEVGGGLLDRSPQPAPLGFAKNFAEGTILLHIYWLEIVRWNNQAAPVLRKNQRLHSKVLVGNVAGVSVELAASAAVQLAPPEEDSLVLRAAAASAQ